MQPLVLAQFRFIVAAVILLLTAHVFLKQKFPSKKEWKQLTIYGLLNITIYLGCYVIAMQEVTAGVGALAISISPVFISFFSVFFLKEKISTNVFVALLLGTIGVLLASWPLFSEATVTPKGLLLLLFSMLAYAIGQVYFAGKSWNNLSLITINGWQTFIGGLFLLPVTSFFYKADDNNYSSQFLWSTLWLAIPVSIFAMLLWLWLLNKNAIKAGLWLFLCPIFGYLIAAVILEERITGFTIAGVGLVIFGLALAQQKSILSKLNRTKNNLKT